MTQKRLAVFLDIDGTILDGSQPARHAPQFIEHVVSSFPTRWLTTHVRGAGDSPLPMLSRHFDERTMELLEQVKPTSWQTLKTEVLPFGHPFLWFDDHIMQSEQEILQQHGALNSWIQVDLRSNPDHLAELILLPELQPVKS